MIKASDLTLVGRINKTHGINGELSVSFFEDAVMDILQEDSCVFLNIDGIFVPFFLASVRSRGTESLLLTFDGEESQKDVTAFVGHDVYMANSSLEGIESELSDGLYAGEFIGFKAFDDKGDEIGEIVDIDDNPDNPLFVLNATSGEKIYYIPIVDEFITDISTENNTITFDLPEGLLNL